MRSPRACTTLLLALPLAVAAEDPVGFAPGEETVLELRYLGVQTGEGRVVVGAAEGSLWPVIFQARTAGAIGFIDIREHLVSYWDTKTRLSRGSDLQAVEMGDYHQDRLRFDRAAGRAVFSQRRQGRLRTRTHDVPAATQDLSSAFIWLRLQRLAVGERHEIPIISQDHQFAMTAEVVGRERIDTPAGSFDCVRVSVRTGLGGPFSTRRDSAIWLSDDPRHVIVRVAADFAVGSVVGTLKRYRPGIAPPPHVVTRRTQDEAGGPAATRLEDQRAPATPQP